ncbi:MAG: hypothetical protein HRT74_11525, partial [Flavobacteriales bacterium]|nr:hypothetical protein [Flavobacteriales bacterium]
MLRKSLLGLLFFFATAMGYAQTSSISAYSRFGLGELHRIGTTPTYSLGGMTAPVADRFFLNPDNPGSYSWNQQTTFQVGVRAQQLRIDDGERTQELGFTNLNHAFINMKRTGSPWGMVLGIPPYSSTGYD